MKGQFIGTLEFVWCTNAITRAGILCHGVMGCPGWCSVPRVCEVYACSSAVTGPFGSEQEYGGGLNRYINKSRQGRLSLQAVHILRSPAKNILYPYRAGTTGTAIQPQFVLAS